MEQRAEVTVVGLPGDFSMTEDEARALGIDGIVEGASLDHGAFGAFTLLGQARIAATERDDFAAADALQLLVVVTGFGPAHDPRRGFTPFASGTFTTGGGEWRGALPSDLTDAHVAALTTLLSVISSPVLRARIGDVLWTRVRPRNRVFAQAAIEAYLTLARLTFDPDHWFTSYQQLGRAFVLATLLGPAAPERATVVRTAFEFSQLLDARDPLYYTQRIIGLLLDVVSAPAELQALLDRARRIAEDSERAFDFNRARAYYDVAIPLSRRLEQNDVTRTLRLARAETHVSEAMRRPTEMLRSMDLRIAVQELRRVGASRERRDQVAQLLDEAQAIAVNEMVPIGTPLGTGDLPQRIEALLRGKEPMQSLWLLARAFNLPTRDAARARAEASLEQHRFAFGFNRQHLASDGRQEGETPGALGAEGDAYEEAVDGVMRFNAAQTRITAAFGIIEPGRRQLVAAHDYTLTEIQMLLQSRPFIPQGHVALWAKGIHAGLVGEYDIAVHLLAPQIENALRTVLHRHGTIVYSTSESGVQSLVKLERVLQEPLTTEIFGSEIVFALDTSLAERLGANMRNSVAHGIINDGAAQSYEAAFVWWLALRLVLFYGPPSREQSESQAS